MNSKKKPRSKSDRGEMRSGGDAQLYTRRYERLRGGATGAMALLNRNGASVIVSRGVAAWMGILDQMPAAVQSDAKVADVPMPAPNEIVNVLADMMRPHLDAIATEHC